MLPRLLRTMTPAGADDKQFLPAKTWQWALWLFQNYIRLDLALHNRLHIGPADLTLLQNLPAGKGIILTPNHTDETDYKVCVELSRLTGRRFLYMMNREAFEECYGIAGWWVQRVGAFSVDRGGGNTLEQSKRYAIDIVGRGLDVLVVFPEGEISYLNDVVQPLKSGAVDIALKAIVEERQKRSEWTAYLVPMAIKYRYGHSIAANLEKRIQRIEKRLHQHVLTHELQMRLGLIIAELLSRQEIAHNLRSGSDRLLELSQRVQDVRQSILQELEEKYPDASSAHSRSGLLDRSLKLSSYLRGLPKGVFSKESLAQMKKDLKELARVGQMASWQPEYVELNPSQERLAETVLKLEREVYRIKRPHQLATREVYVRIGEPIDLGSFVSDYLQDPHAVRHLIAARLRGILQSLIDNMEAH